MELLRVEHLSKILQHNKKLRSEQKVFCAGAYMFYVIFFKSNLPVTLHNVLYTCIAGRLHFKGQTAQHSKMHREEKEN